MERDTIFTIILCIFIIVASLKIFIESDTFNLTCIESNINGNKYCVRERSKLHLVVDLFARTTIKMDKLLQHLKIKYPNKLNVQRLQSNCDPTKIKEILPTSKYTAYSENKGEKVALCTTTEKDNDVLIDDNTLMFVVLHEMSHICTKSVGHTDEFWNNFKFMLTEAVDIGIYKNENYKKNPKTYCGMKITDNPYYDM